jgi:hypothetical protein
MHPMNETSSGSSALELSLDKNCIPDPPADLRLKEILGQVDWVESLTFSGDSRHLIAVIRPKKERNKVGTTKFLSWATSTPNKDPERVSLVDQVRFRLTPRCLTSPAKKFPPEAQSRREAAYLLCTFPYSQRLCGYQLRSSDIQPRF